MSHVVALISSFALLIAIVLFPFAIYYGLKKKKWVLMKIAGSLFFFYVIAVVVGIFLVSKGYWTVPSTVEETSFLVNYEKYSQLPINLVPMYGTLEGRVKTDKQRGYDDEFINTALSSGMTRSEASKHVVDVAWSFVENNDLDTAMKRFNQAWLLDNDNPGSYRGFIYLLERTGQADSAEEVRQYAIKMGIDID